jgi:hypothetical protein
MDPGTVKIFTSSDVPRLRYIAGILLGDLMGLSWDVVTDKRKLGKNPVINYSQEEVKGSFRIFPDTLLFESGIRKTEPRVTEWRGLPVFFQSPEGCDLPFDIFAASFFLISRYEEYTGYAPDEHDRFTASASFSGRNGFLSRPVIDLWVKEWIRVIIIKFPRLVFRKSSFRNLVTVDIDEPFEYLGKDVLRNIGSLIRDLGSKAGKAGEHYRTVAKGEKDPWDVFDYIFERIDGERADARFFIPLGDRSAHDRHPSWQNEDYRKLISRVSSKYHAGIHPSFDAAVNIDRLHSEIDRFRKVTKKDPSASRFHFLRIKFPVSYQNLADSGIREDYSLGYHDQPGFRAGTAHPFPFYNIEKETAADLKIYPFQVMDGTFLRYLKAGHEQAEKMISSLVNETRDAGGTFISIWHNTSLLDEESGRKWRSVFESLLAAR